MTINYAENLSVHACTQLNATFTATLNLSVIAHFRASFPDWLFTHSVTNNLKHSPTACQKSPFCPLMAAVVMTLAWCTHICQIFAIPLCRSLVHIREILIVVRVLQSELRGRKFTYISTDTLTCNCGSARLEYTPTGRLRHNCPSYNVVVLL